jgi:hypothetical protein
MLLTQSKLAITNLKVCCCVKTTAHILIDTKWHKCYTMFLTQKEHKMAQPKKQYAITFKFQERFNLEPITINVKSSSDAKAYFNAKAKLLKMPKIYWYQIEDVEQKVL